MDVLLKGILWAGGVAVITVWIIVLVCLAWRLFWDWFIHDGSGR